MERIPDNTELKELKHRINAMLYIYDLNPKLKNQEQYKHAKYEINQMFAKLEKAEKDAKDSNATMTKLNAQVNQLEKEKTEVMKEVEDLKGENQNATETLLAYMTKCDELKTKQSELLSKCQDNHLKTITMINEANVAKEAKNVAEQYAKFAEVSKERLINETRELLETIDTLDALKKDD